MTLSFAVIRTDNFIAELTEAYDWILDSNYEIQQNFDLAQSRADALIAEIDSLVSRIVKMPSTGTLNPHSGVRQHPVHDGRYSVRWMVDKSNSIVALISLLDNERPKELRYRLQSDFED